MKNNFMMIVSVCRGLRLFLKQQSKTLALGLGLFLFAALGNAYAQTPTPTVNIYMKDGTQVVNSSNTYNFYDSHGPSHASDGTINFWDRWYNHNEEFTFTFKPATTDYKIKVQFNTFTAYDKDGNSIGNWALRLNDDYLYVYEGEGINNAKLIAAYTGNTRQSFTVMADGAITFYFRSNEKYREEGWAAVVTQEAAMAPQAPFIRRSTCENEIEMLPTTRKAKIYYTTVTDGFGEPDDPTTSSNFYTHPINFTGDMTVKAISVLDGQTSPTSSVVTVDIPASELLSAPAVPTVTLTADNTVVMTPPAVPSGLNESYVVRYTMTTDGTDPADPTNRSTAYSEPIAITTPGTKIKARTFAVSCDNWCSGIIDRTYGDATTPLNAPLPQIIFADGLTYLQNQIIAKLNGEDYDIRYTLDGTDPTTNGTVGGPGTVVLNNLTPGTTIKAQAFKNGDPNFTPSAVVTAIYSPNGSQVSGGIVLLDDREDHNWSYYSDGDQPIHNLKPADVKIIYNGNGNANMTTDTENGDTPTSFSADATGVKVGVASEENQSTFVYLQTLENADPEGTGNAYPYTTIPNPFQVRPMYSGFTTTDPLTNVNIGVSEEDKSAMLPTKTNSTYSVTQQIYTQAEIGRSGQIKGITFFADTYNGTRNLTIYLKHTDKTSFTTDTDWESVASTDIVFNDNVTLTGETTITFSTPFTYNGTQNLLICVDDNTGSTNAESKFFVYPTANRSIGVYGTNHTPTSMSGVTGTRNNYNNMVKFTLDGGNTTHNDEHELGHGSTLGQNYLPTFTDYKYDQTVQIYTATEMSGAKKITSIAFRNNTNNSATRSLRVYLDHITSGFTFPANNWTALNGLGLFSTCHYNGSVTFNGSNTNSGWTVITLSTPFYYNGNDDLVIYVQDRTGTQQGANPQFFRYATGGYHSMYHVSNGDYGTLSNTIGDYDGWGMPASATRMNNNAQIIFGYQYDTHNADVYVTIGERAVSTVVPVSTDKNYSISQQIFTAEEMQAVAGTPNTGLIKSFAIHSSGGNPIRNISVYFKNIANDRFESATNWYQMNNTTNLVFSGDVTFANNGWTTITLPTAFSYNGEQNLLVCVVDNTGTATTAESFDVFMADNVQRTLYYSSGSAIDVSTISATGTLSNRRTQIKFVGGTRGDSPRAIADGDNPYRGFYRWKVKRLSGGLTIKSKDGGTTYGVGAMIPAETEIQFITDNAQGNEVEFDALWAQAYVKEGNSNLSTYVSASEPSARERNFHIVTAPSQNASDYQKSYPCTVSSYSPNGISSGGSLAGAFSAAADTKFENISITSATSSTWNAAGKNLTLGRGVTGTVGYVCGHNASGNANAVKYTVRLESGIISNFDLFNTSGGTFSNTVQAKVVFGCDYDRANNDNSKLDIAPNGRVYGKNYYSDPIAGSGNGGGIVFSLPANRNNITFDWVVKSGKIQRNLHENASLGRAEGGDESIYLGAPSSANNLQYSGKRRITIEGGEMASIAGGVNNSTTGYATYAVTQGRTVMVRMKGGTVRGAIYGGGEFGGSSGDVEMVFTGGRVKGWIAGGCNGTRTTDGQQYGSTFIYVGGNAQVIQACGDGYDPFDNPDHDEPYIGGNTGYGINGAYGGNIFGAGCGIKKTTYDESEDPTTHTYENPAVTVGRVFGTTIVMADNAELGRDIYGGGKFGFVADNTNTDYGLVGNEDMKSRIYILGGTVHGDVMGGSRNQINQTSEIYVRGGRLVGRKINNPDDDLEYYGDVYGGCDSWGEMKGTATIVMTGGEVTNIFGGGYGISSNMTQDVTITINGGMVKGTVYGGGETGTVTANTYVTINGGIVNDVFGAGKGGNLAINKATISGQTFVNINGGEVYGAVYGGGEQGNVNKGDVTNIFDFSDKTNTAYNAGTSYISDGWNRYNGQSSGTHSYVPRVSNQTNYSNITNNDGNYLLMSCNRSNLYSSYARAVMPSYTNIVSASFKYRYQTTSYGDLQLGYSTGNANNFTPIKTLDKTTDWTTYTLTAAEIKTIADAGGRITFNFTNVNNNNTTYYSAAIDDVEVIVDDIIASTVTVTGGTIEGDVFGGGKMGQTKGNTIVTVNGGQLNMNVFGGAYGERGSVYVAGKKTVNIMDGKIVGSVYGGSRYANDALTMSPSPAFATNTTTTPSNIVNISGGQIEQHVYSAGYYGQTFGSTYTFIGLKASEDAPHCYRAPGVDYEKHKLIIKGNLYAGSDWGTFSGGDFGAPTTTGNSNIYIDGTGYKTNDKDHTQEYYMKIRGSILGCGTSADAGKGERLLVMKNFGEDMQNHDSDKAASPFLASIEFNSIQRWHEVRIDNCHVRILGQGRITSSNIAEQYSLYDIDQHLYLANGSTFVLNSPTINLKALHSVTCPDIYATTPAYTAVGYGGLGDPGSATDNKLRINNGCYLKVYHQVGETPTTGEPFGQLQGFFHLMIGVDGNGADIYARPKQSTDGGNIIPDGYDNDADGGFVSYLADDNTYDEDGGTVASGGVQIPYENHTDNMSRAGEQFYRIWRYGGDKHTMAAVFNAIADGNTTTYPYKTVQVSVALPSWRAATNYYRFGRDGEGNLLVNYGNDVITYNGANYQAPGDPTNPEVPTGVATDNVTWMYYNTTTRAEEDGQESTQTQIASALNSINANPDLNFGLTVAAQSGLTGDKHIICAESGELLAGVYQSGANAGKPLVTYTCGTGQLDQTPMLTFELTYSNALTLTRTNDPILIPLVQCDASGHVVDSVTVSLTVATSTDITMGSQWDIYAFMDHSGTTKDRTTLRIEIPKFEVYQTGQESEFRIKNVSFRKDNGVFHGKALGGTPLDVVSDGEVNYRGSDQSEFDLNEFGFVIQPVVSESSSDTWRFASDEIDPAGGCGDEGLYIGLNGGRSPVALDFTLIYGGINDITSYTELMDVPRVEMGTLTLTIEFDNFKYGEGEYHKKTFDIDVQIYRKGQARNFYLDGLNGDNIVSDQSGDFPDKAYKTMNFLLNRSDFLPGDNIYIINTITMAKDTKWDGNAKQSKVNVYRYPGDHTLSNNSTTMEGFDNSALTGALVNVQSDLSINGMQFDGKKDLVTADAPMFYVEDGATLSLGSNTTLKNNKNNNSDGGAVHVDYGGTLKMSDNAIITGNESGQGGGVFMDGKMIVSGDVKVENNTITGTTTPSNVWLAPANAGEDYRVVQIGTADNDGYGALTENAHIGVHKTDWSNGVDGYMPIVSSEMGTMAYMELPYSNQNIIFPDVVNYPLERYKDPNYLYWVSSWVTEQDHEPTVALDGVAWAQTGTIGTPGSTVTITTPDQLAWMISLVNGENGKTPNNFAGTTVNITADLDMSAHMWVPIGDETTAFAGNFNGNGHTITGVGSTLGNTYMGLFGQTEDATIKDVTVQSSFSSSAEHIGTIAGKMTGGSITNVGGSGNLTSTNSSRTNDIGGLVGTTEGIPVIHSAYAAVTIQGTQESIIGGLVGINGTGDTDYPSNLYNSYANVVLSYDNEATTIGGLVGINKLGGTVENCYSMIGDETFPGFAATNQGTIKFCYTNKANGYVGTGSVAPTGHGTYTATTLAGGRKYRYEHRDQDVNIESGETNTYVTNGEVSSNGALAYDEDKHEAIIKGLLLVLNKWVDEKNVVTETTSPYYHKYFSSWTRTMGSPINDDYPVLLMPGPTSAPSICLGSRDGRFVEYDSNLNSLITTFNGTTEGGNIYLYRTQPIIGSATDPDPVSISTNSNVRVYIHENIGLTQVTGNNLNARVAVTFDNSKGTDDLGGLPYDWHMFSTPLAVAPLGIQYSRTGTQSSEVPIGEDEISLLSTGYYPTNTPFASFDFYCYDEPSCHWINFKRNTGDHWHQNTGAPIPYTNESKLTQGKGYMMAIDAPTMLMSDGKLTNDGTSTTPTVNVSYTAEMANNMDALLSGVNLIGNPYQSYLDFDMFAANDSETGWESPNNGKFASETPAYYILDADNGGYITYPDQASTNPMYAPRYIHPHQGFFVAVGSETTLTFTNDMRKATGDTHSYFRGEQVNYPLVNLICSDSDGKRDLTTVEVNRPELGGASKLRNMRAGNASIYAHFADNGYQALFAPVGVREVPVRFEAFADGEYTITWSMFNGEFSYAHLIDNLTGKDIDLLTTKEYKFDATTDDYVSRFKLVFEVMDPNDPAVDSETFAYFDGNSWVVTGKGALQLFDMTGRCLMNTKVEGLQTSVALPKVASGVYTFRLIDGENTKVQKIVIDR